MPKEGHQPGRRQRKIRFNGRVHLHHIPYVAEEDHEVVWYSSVAIAEAQRNEISLRKFISSDKRLYEKHAARLYGQGVMTEEQAERERIAVERAIDAVLREQSRQEYTIFGTRKSGRTAVKDEKIAQAYHSHSQKALVRAQIKAASIARNPEGNEKKPPESSSRFSPSRFFKRRISTRLSPRSTKALKQKLIPRSSISVQVRPSQLVNYCTTPAAR
ncbi:MAG: hypothetical protein SGBAC_005610 [Bacillariaceae sp.]